MAFDNIGEALVLSPPLLAQYLELATQVADEILPPDNGRQVAVPREYDIGATGLAASSLTSIEGDHFRIVSSKSNAHTAGWPSRFEATQSGVYRLTVDASTFQTDNMFYPRQDKPFRLTVYAKLKTEQTYGPIREDSQTGIVRRSSRSHRTTNVHLRYPVEQGRGFWPALGKWAVSIERISHGTIATRPPNARRNASAWQGSAGNVADSVLRRERLR